MRTSEAIDKLSPALVAALSAMPEIDKTRVNPFFKSKYAGLPDIMDAVRPVMAENGLSVIQGGIATSDGTPGITTRLQHTSGQWIESDMFATPAKNDPQGIGSAVTYLRRYGLCAMLSITPDEDDDGNSASGATKPPARAPAATRKPVAMPTAKPAASKPNAITAEQRKLLFATATEVGFTKDGLKAFLETLGITSTKDILSSELDAVLAEIKRAEELPM